ncbi:MAG: DUF4097 family beta strand repeat-containing protein [Chloroflexota bacterium]|nr:DUF4097 family beta strand repeat-containing protein [Chloroflexota bacterium]
MATFVRTQEIEHEIGLDGSLQLRITSADVQIRAIEGSVARARAIFEIRAADEAEADQVFAEVQLRVARGDGTLAISEPDRHMLGLGAGLHRLLGRPYADLSVKVELPAGAEVRVDGVSADLTATGLRGNQHFKTVSGDLVLTDVTGKLGLHSVSGDATVRAVGELALEAGSVSGDLSIVAPRLSRLHANTVSGDLEIEAELAGGESHRVETVSGDLTLGLVGSLNLEVRGLSTDVRCDLPHRSEGSRDRRRYIIGEDGPQMLFGSMSGDVSVRAARRLTAAGPAQPPEPRDRPEPPAPPPPPDERLAILHALERGELDVDEALRRLSGEGSGA